ncbi:pentapeptide repeat-containing protein [Phytomonospora endophytica]|uniref:pentapeptide repeat-containing protein n=1 Tax=Phytomonospora endophytica TaxID=714109 RepID=UPI0019415677|nr:pentapeptide repeat-containing protein [Phytomonospora endophytica]
MKKVWANLSGWWRCNRKWLLWTLGPLLALGVVATVAVVLWSWLSDVAGADPRARVTAVSTLVSVIFGFGGLVTLSLLVHRQVLQARAQDHVEAVAADAKYDASEKRANELFSKSVEQLGHDKAAVRVGALHALDALGQEHEGRRRAVMDVWCAYLRMSPAATSTPKVFIVGAAPAAATEPGPTWPAEELHVRATVQRLIAHHLRPPDKQRKKKNPKATGEFWGPMAIDLTNAQLYDLDFDHCRLGSADFTGVAFAGDAWFRGATFAGDAEFNMAAFAGVAWFREATFAGDARFGEATFSGDVRFGDATFSEGAWFRAATFSEGAWFGGATFAGDARFNKATFSRNVWFEQATFTGNAAADFAEARVLRPDRGHVLPTGWRVGATDGVTGLPLVCIPDPLATEVQEPGGT